MASLILASVARVSDKEAERVCIRLGWVVALFCDGVEVAKKIPSAPFGTFRVEQEGSRGTSLAFPVYAPGGS